MLSYTRAAVSVLGIRRSALPLQPYISKSVSTSQLAFFTASIGRDEEPESAAISAYHFFTDLRL